MSKIAVIFLCIGMLMPLIGLSLIIYVFQYDCDVNKTPEFLFDLQSIGYSLFMSMPYLFTIAFYKVSKLPRLMNFASLISLAFWILVVFNMIQEVMGSNSENSASELIVSIVVVSIILSIQYAYNIRGRNDCHS